MKLTYLITEADIYKGCKDGMAQLRACESMEDMVNCYYDRIDFCLANNFPDNDFFEEHSEELKPFGIYHNAKEKINSARRLVILGDSDIDINVERWGFSRIYVKGNSKVRITARPNSIVMVDALDSAEITVNKSTSARVKVFLYDKAKCTGKSEITHTNKKTYDL